MYVRNEASNEMSKGSRRTRVFESLGAGDEVSQEVEVGVGVEQGGGDYTRWGGVEHRSLVPT